MKKIDGTPKSIRELFTGVKYTIHYCQREYQWQTKQIEELLGDLTEDFFEFYSELIKTTLSSSDSLNLKISHFSRMTLSIKRPC
jgi:uncharacterized protein with ParB-like and HNH nuclease domain